MKYIKILLPFLVMLVMSGASAKKPVATSYDEAHKSWSDQVIYFLLVDRFYNGNKKNDINTDLSKNLWYHGGDFQGLTSKLSYIDNMNFNTLLFTPIMDNRNSDFYGHWGLHGYWIIDHYRIDEHFGTNKDYQAFNKARIKKKHRLLFDIVLNHVDWDHPWTKKHPKWFHTLESIKDWNDPKQMVEGRISGLPDLDQDHPEVYKRLMKYSKYWIDFSQADGFRIDAVKHIDHDFWKKYILDINSYVQKKYNKKDFLFLAEILHGDPNYYLPYIEDGFNAFYDYPLYYTVADVFARSKTMYNLPSRLQTEDKVFPKNMVLSTFLDNHDMPRFLSLNDTVNYQDMHQAISFYMTIRGLPMIYYGTESRLKGKTGEIGRKTLNLKQASSYNFIKKINKIRTSSPSLTLGARDDLEVSKHHYVFRKITPLEESLIFISRGPKEQKVQIELDELSLYTKHKKVKDVLNNKVFKIISNKNKKYISGTLGKKDFLIFTLKDKNSLYEKITKKTSEEKLVKVQLKVQNVKLTDKVFMVGNDSKIGNWNPQKALLILQNPKTKIFETSFKFGVKKMMEYKFIIIDKDNKVTWEQTDNRFLFMPNKLKMIKTQWEKP